MSINIRNRFSKIITFAERPSFFAGFFPLCYEKAFYKVYIPFCKREIFYSLIHDLSKTPAELLASFSANTRNEIRRGEKENFICEFGIDTEIAQWLHIKMAEEKGMSSSEIIKIYSSLIPFLFTTSVKAGSNILAAHTFLISEEKKLVMLKTSASSFRSLSKEQQKISGFANRYLHYQEMLYFKEKGYLWYDFGGYAEGVDENDPLYSINMFKSGFRGNLTVYYNYKSFLYIIMTYIYLLFFKKGR